MFTQSNSHSLIPPKTIQNGDIVTSKEGITGIAYGNSLSNLSGAGGSSIYALATHTHSLSDCQIRQNPDKYDIKIKQEDGQELSLLNSLSLMNDMFDFFKRKGLIEEGEFEEFREAKKVAMKLREK